MSYVDGYIIPVPAENKQKYIDQAKMMAGIFKEFGALEIYENWGDDVPDGDVTSFSKAVMCKKNEVVVFSWVVWPSKEVRDKGWQAAMQDPRMKPEDNPMPFDGKRLIYGGFSTIINE